jgi:hypothetical protein
VLTDLACAIVLDAVAISDIAVLEHQREVWNPPPPARQPTRTRIWTHPPEGIDATSRA